MTTVNFHYIPPKERHQPSLAASKKSNTLPSSSTSGPGATAAFTSPSEISNALKIIREGVFGRDIRLVMQGSAAFVSHTFAIIYSFATLGNYFSTGCGVLAYAFKTGQNNLQKAATIAQTIFGHPAVMYTTLMLGAFISMINGFFESYDLMSQIKFRRHLKFSEKITKDNAFKKFLHLVKYLDLSPEQKLAIIEYGKQSLVITSLEEGSNLNLEKLKHIKDACHTTTMRKLSELISPWLATEIDHEAFEIFNKLDTDKTQAIEWLQQMYELMEIQSKKALIVHTVGLAAIITGVLATTLSFFAFPGVLPLFALLAILSFGFATARYVIYAGYINSREWTFRPANLVPVFLRENAPKVINALTSLPSKAINAVYENKNFADRSALFLGPFGCTPGMAVSA